MMKFLQEKPAITLLALLLPSTGAGTNRITDNRNSNASASSTSSGSSTGAGIPIAASVSITPESVWPYPDNAIASTHPDRKDQSFRLYPKNTLIKGPVKTGKFHQAIMTAVGIIEGKDSNMMNIEPVPDVLEHYQQYVDGRPHFTYFPSRYQQ